ncbi:methyltransferase [uncultured Campylobacter sp.]|uniref:tRNA1(Val) (adenine(37)-N6)-methyltransferase n=1 Tax=uncultured Campylobacter sp. TaxID=218934 RepID=UPI00262B263D|nr:methyltransferase [uncultured Campylobacter sp.]
MILAQLSSGYRYNSDTLVLYDFIRSNLQNFSGRVLDVGAGCGILGLLLKRDYKNASLNSLDILQINGEISKFNAYQNGLEMEFINADFANFKDGEKFDLIVSNPPFYHDGAKQSEDEHIRVSRYVSSLNLKDFIRGISLNLKPHKRAFFCYAPDDLGEIVSYLKEFKLNLVCLKFIHTKADKPANLALFEVRNNSNSKLKVLPPLVMSENGSHTKEALEIFKKADTNSTDYVGQA